MNRHPKPRKRIYPDRVLTGAEKTKRYRERWPDRAKDLDERNGARRRQATKNGLPRYVYMYVSPKGFVAYVGRGTAYRMGRHRQSKWYEPDMILHRQLAMNEWDAMRLEGEWGERFQPRYNKEGFRDRPKGE